MILPEIGFGTAPYRAGRAPVDMEEPVRIALDAGYRMFDLAEGYGNERAVGRALKSRGAPQRRELFLIGKLWRTNFRPDRVRSACERSLQRLGVERFDLYLLHAPGALRFIAPLEDAEDIGWDELVRRATPKDDRGELTEDLPVAETWDAMNALVTAGLAGAVGVSNFSVDQIDALGTRRPAANQIACWPMDPARIEAQQELDIALLGYSPLNSKILDAPMTRQIAAAHRRPPAQIVLRWLMNRGLRPLTSSSDPAHIRQGPGALEIDLSADEMDALAAYRHSL